MRVDLAQSAASQLANEASPKQVNARNDSAAATAGADDRATLTTDTQSLGSLVSAAMSSPEIRQDKVDGLRQAISSGSYVIDPGKVAASMIDEQA